MALDAGSTGAIAAAIAVPLTMRALARLFPAKTTPAVGISPEDLLARYRKWELGFALAMLVVVVPVGFLLWFGLRALGSAHASLLPSAEIQWVTGRYYWAIPALFLAITLMLPLFTWVARRLLGERYAEYMAYQQLRSGMDVVRVANMLCTSVAIASAVFIFLGLDWSVRVEPDGLVVNRYLGVGEERYAFADVRAIRTAPALIAPNGNRVPRREFVVVLDGGRSWSTNNVLSDTSLQEKQRLAAILCERSGVRVEEVEVLRNEEL